MKAITSIMILSLFVLSGASFAQDQAQTSAQTEVVSTPIFGSTSFGEEDTMQSNVSVMKQVPPEMLILRRIEQEMKKKRGSEVFERSSVPSLVFTPEQYALLREARVGFNTRVPSAQELQNAGKEQTNPMIAVRNIKLGGIAFSNPDEWTIWLNGTRVTPDALPQQAIDLRVYKDFIEMKWFDAQTNQIFPVRLRTNQTFNLDARVFLPG